MHICMDVCTHARVRARTHTSTYIKHSHTHLHKQERERRERESARERVEYRQARPPRRQGLWRRRSRGRYLAEISEISSTSVLYYMYE